MKKQGLLTVFAAITIQLTLGVAYIWSVFQTGVANSIFNGGEAAAALTFSLLLATLTIGSVIGGKLAAAFGTRIVVFFGGIILSAGFFLASFVTSDFSWFLWVTYGVMGGVGMGFTYSTTIACAQKWYPHKKGLVTGIIVSALGFGGVIFTPIVESLIKIFDGANVTAIKNNLELNLMTPSQAKDAMLALGDSKEFGEFNTFIVLGAVFFVVCTVGCLFLKNPPDGYMMDETAAKPAANGKSAAISTKGKKDYSPSQMLRTPEFYLITATFLLACMGGLMMINFAKPIAQAKGLAETATIGVLAISMFNSMGRLIWGIVSDKIGRKNTIIILLSGSAALSLLVNAANGYWIFVLIAFIGFFYGGFLSSFPSLIADIFGSRHMATNYGIVLLGFGSGAIISSQIAGHYKNIAANDISLMFSAFVIASCCAAAGIVMMLVLKVISKRRKAESE